MSFFHQQPNNAQFTALMELGKPNHVYIQEDEIRKFRFFFQTKTNKTDESIHQ